MNDDLAFKTYLATRRTKNGVRIISPKTQGIIRSDLKGLRDGGRKIDLKSVGSYINALEAYRDFLRAAR